MTTLVVEITREGEKLKMSAFEKAKGIDVTIKHYSECNISSQQIKILCDSITHLFNKANRQHGQENDFVNELKKNGRALFDHLLTAEVKKVIQKSESKFLLLSIDEQLVQIPWELLFDGEEFLCIHFAMGRTVRTKQKISDNKLRGVNKPVKMLITADPMGDLDSAYKEGISIRNEMDKRKNKINVLSRTGDVSLDFIKKNIRDYDIVHFAGHAEYNNSNPSESGWLLKDGTFTAKDIVELGTTASLPSIVFSNACQSGQTEEWEIEEGFEEKIYGLANAFLLTGVRHYIGTFWKVMDEPCYYFANEFYKNVIEGTPIGEAVRLARIQLINKYGYESIVWSSYMLYGDPSINLFFISSIRKTLKENVFKRQIMILSMLLGSIIGTGLLGFVLYSKYFKELEIKANKPYVFKNTIAVMPFENLNRDKENDWIGYGFADSISIKLERLGKFKIIDETQINKILSDIKLTNYVDKDNAIRIANFVGADRIVIGAFQKVGENIRFTVRLINTKDGVAIGSMESTNAYNNLFKLQDDIALKIPELLNIIIGEEEKAKLRNFMPTNNVGAYELLVRSEQAQRDGNVKKAIDLCKQAIQIDPEYWAPNIVLALSFTQLKDYQAAKLYYEKALKLSEQQKNKYFILISQRSLGLFLIQTHQYKDAINVFFKAIEITKDLNDSIQYGEILLLIAKSYMAEPEYEKAKEIILECKKIFQDSNNQIGLVEVYKILGDYYSHSKDYVNAEINYKEALKLADVINLIQETMLMYINLSKCYSNIGNHDEAIIFLHKAIFLGRKLNDKMSKVNKAYGYLLLANAYEAKGQYGNAEQFYGKSKKLYNKLNMQMEYRNIWYFLGYMYMYQLRYDKASRCFEFFIKKARECNNKSELIRALPLSASVYEKMGRFQDAVNNCNELLVYKNDLARDKGALIDLYVRLGICSGWLKNTEKSEEYFKFALNEANSLKQLFYIGYVYKNIGEFYYSNNIIDKALENYKQAEIYFDKAQSKEGSFKDIGKGNLEGLYRDLAEYYKKTGDLDNASSYYKKALPIAKELNSPMFKWISSCLQDIEDTRKEKQKEIKNINAKQSYDQASIYFSNGEYEKAIEQATQANKIEPNNETIISLLSLSYGSIGKYEEAILVHLEYLKMLEKQNDIKGAIRQCFWIGDNYYRLCRCGDAKKYYNKAFMLTAKSHDEKMLISTYAGYCKVLLELKEHDKAKKYAKKIINYYKNGEKTFELSAAYQVLSKIYFSQGEKQKGFEFLKLCLEIEEFLNGFDLGRIYEKMSYYYQDEDIIKSIQYINMAIDSFKKQHDQISLGNAYNILGHIYEKASQFDKAIENYKISQEFSEKLNDFSTIMRNYYALENVYFILKDYKSSEEYRNKFVDLNRKIKNEQEAGKYLGLIAVNRIKTNIIEAEKIFQKYNDIIKKNNSFDKKALLEDNFMFGNGFYEEHDYKKSIIYLTEASNIAEEIQDKQILRPIYLGLAASYHFEQDMTNALIFYRKTLKIAEELGDEKLVHKTKKIIEGIEQNKSEVTEYKDLYRINR